MSSNRIGDFGEPIRGFVLWWVRCSRMGRGKGDTYFWGIFLLLLMREVMSMVGHWEDLEQMKARVGSEGEETHVLWFVGIVFAILGVIADAANHTIGLESSTWLLLAVVALLASMGSRIEWAVAWYLRTGNK